MRRKGAISHLQVDAGVVGLLARPRIDGGHITGEVRGDLDDVALGVPDLRLLAIGRGKLVWDRGDFEVVNAHAVVVGDGDDALAVVALANGVEEFDGESFVDFGVIVFKSVKGAAHAAVLGLVTVAGLSFLVEALVVRLVGRDRVCVPPHLHGLVGPLGIELFVDHQAEVVALFDPCFQAVDLQPGLVFRCMGSR